MDPLARVAALLGRAVCRLSQPVASRPKRSLLRDRIYDWAIDHGEWFKAEEAAQVFGTSRGPVIQALNKLGSRIEVDRSDPNAYAFRAVSARGE